MTFICGLSLDAVATPVAVSSTAALTSARIVMSLRCGIGFLPSRLVGADRTIRRG